jgi:hypothetical protein
MAAHHRKAAIWVVALALATLAWNIAAEPHLFFHPVDAAVRGYELDVHVFDAESCTLNVTKTDGSTITTEQITATSVIFSLVVPIDADGAITATVTCDQAGPDEKKPVVEKTIHIISGVALSASASSSPLPADVNSYVIASFTLVNKGSYPAHDLQCTVTAPATVPFANISCGQEPPQDSSPTCGFDFLNPSESTTISVGFAAINKDIDVSVTCTGLNIENPFKHPYTILVKADAKIEVAVADPPAPVLAGSNVTVVTTISNTGRAQADKLNCSLPVPSLTHFAFLRSSAPQCAPVPGPLNATEVLCTFGDFNANENLTVSLDFHLNSSLAKDIQLNFTWTCKAEELPDTVVSRQVTTKVKGDLGLTLPTNSSIDDINAVMPTALLFRLTNAGPSDVTNGTCGFVVPVGVNVSSWTHAKSPNDFACVRSDIEFVGVVLNCTVSRLSPAGADFNLGLKPTSKSLTNFSVLAECQSIQPAASPFPITEFKINVNAAPTPQPPYQPPYPPTDNTLVVVVTVIVAVGLLIVIAIWWRKKQERAGWDAAGPSPRSPSLNRYSEMELSIRSDD